MLNKYPDAKIKTTLNPKTYIIKNQHFKPNSTFLKIRYIVFLYMSCN